MVCKKKNRLRQNKKQIQIKMKTFLKTLVLLFGITVSVNAQDSTGVDLKFGPDKSLTEENMSLYMEPYKKKNYDEAYKYWSYVYHNAPLRTRNLYIHGPKMIESFMKKDTENAAAWKDSLMMVYDQYIEYYPTREGEINGKKGTKLYRFYGKEMTDEQLNEVNNYLKTAYTLSKNKISSTVINYYFLSTAKLVKKELNTKEELLDMYANLGSVIESKKADYSNKVFELDEKVTADSTYVHTKKEKRTLKIANAELKKLNIVESNMEKTLAPHATCEKLDEIFTKTFEANQENVDWLKRASKLMKKKGCTDSDIFFKIADKQFQMEPSADAAINLAYTAVKQKDYTKAFKYIDSALEQEDEAVKKAEYLNLKSQLQLKRGSYASAASSARQAASYRRGWGAPYLIIGQAYAATSRKCGELQNEFKKRVGYIAAIEKFEYAKSIDPSVTSKANRLIGTYRPQLPSKTQIFEEGKAVGSRHKISGCWVNETVTIRSN